MFPVEIDYSGEGTTDADAARKMIVAAGGSPARDFTLRKQARGKEALDRRLRGYNAGAAYTPVLVLRDLDHLPCAAELVATNLPERHPNCLLRIAVRSMEAWLLADRRAIAAFAQVDVSMVPTEPEALAKPKPALVDMLRATKSRTTRRQLDLDTPEGPTWQQLGAWNSDFIRSSWEPDRAARHAPSLARAMQRLREAIRTAT